MRQHSNLAKDPAEKVVKDIRRATRKQYSAEEKIRTVAVERRDVVRRRGDFSGRSFGLPKYRAGATWCDAVVIFRGEVLASGPCAPSPCAGHCGRNTPCGGTRSVRGRCGRSHSLPGGQIGRRCELIASEDDFEAAPDGVGRHPPI
jgi:hypothetical protein